MIHIKSGGVVHQVQAQEHAAPDDEGAQQNDLQLVTHLVNGVGVGGAEEKLDNSEYGHGGADDSGGKPDGLCARQ